ncbi:capsule biosynthesis protein [Halocynthiibacter namhaensis]|uniref:capsule biosynthesis protein n=1 Tax=Halocynthiibacter namhaensis TaxID=1290553 RepID=UPI0005795983|nr:capsule biosynthesis protein CapA [Halocynthiibacter namhaensis]
MSKISQPSPAGSSFLFLQGPHGPFFSRLGKMLRSAGAEVHRVGFNAGDQAMWFRGPGYIPYMGTPEDWGPFFETQLDAHKVSDIVLYGDTRDIHATAVSLANARGLRVHIFEEGYLRPYWITYERGGSNGNSRLMELNLQDMQKALETVDMDVPEVPANWGDMRQHMFYGALYHWYVMLRNRKYKGFKPHREISVWREFHLYFRSLMLAPFLAMDRIAASTRIKYGGFPFHLALLQLEHDSSFRMHSPFATMTQFLEAAVKGFSEGAPLHHHLVFKAHPLEDGRIPQRREIQRIAREFGVEKRVHYVRGGKLAKLLNHARSAITVNSTAGQQVLWRGLPLKVFGDAIYAKQEFVSKQPLAEFFAQPNRPDTRAYRDYRHFILETSQIIGGYYSARGRRQALRQVVDMMLADLDPYEALMTGNAAPRQQLQSIR